MSDAHELTKSQAASVLATHELVTVEGTDARGFLQGLISQDVDTLQSERASRSLLLSPQGKLRALLWAFASDDRVGLITEAGHGERVAADLAHYKIRVKAVITGPVPVSQVIGADSERYGGVSAPLRTLERAFVWESLPDLPTLGLDAWELIRIEQGEPKMGVDVDERTIPQESGLVEEAVSFTKGCFLGQELVARIDSRGHVNRHLRGLELEQAVAVPARVTEGGEEVGHLTSLAGLPNGGYVGLAMLHRRVLPDTLVEVDNRTARVRDLERFHSLGVTKEEGAAEREQP